MSKPAFVLLVGLLTVPAATASGNPLKALYTTIELSKCRQTSNHPDGGAWLCSGMKGWPVYVAEGDLRAFVSAGHRPEKRQAATQTLGAFNSIFNGKSKRATMEWRIDRQNGRDVPHATILRYWTSRDGARGQVLVVSKVTATEACHVAYIDAVANPDAIALARTIADGPARTFDCRKEATIVGRQGKSPI
jgi:hypothetical protein